MPAIASANRWFISCEFSLSSDTTRLINGTASESDFAELSELRVKRRSTSIILMDTPVPSPLHRELLCGRAGGRNGPQRLIPAQPRRSLRQSEVRDRRLNRLGYGRTPGLGEQQVPL